MATNSSSTLLSRQSSSDEDQLPVFNGAFPAEEIMNPKQLIPSLITTDALRYSSNPTAASRLNENAIDRTQCKLVAWQDSEDDSAESETGTDSEAGKNLDDCAVPDNDADYNDRDTVADEDWVPDHLWIIREALKTRCGRTGEEWLVALDSCTVPATWFDNAEVDNRPLRSFASQTFECGPDALYVVWCIQWVASARVPSDVKLSYWNRELDQLKSGFSGSAVPTEGKDDFRCSE